MRTQMLNLLIRRKIFLRFIKLLLSIYQKNLKWRDLSWPLILFSTHPYKKTHQNIKYYVRKSNLWKHRVRGLCTSDQLLFITNRVSCTDSRNWVPSGQIPSRFKESLLFSLCLCCSHWESLSNQCHLTNTRILHLQSWTFQEAFCGHFNMINVGVWYP